jgi:hypothetical protein
MPFCASSFSPYRSRSFAKLSAILDSQLYGFHLVRAAISRGAEIVLMRSKRLWFDAVPELRTYERLHLVANPRNPVISSLNVSRFGEITTRIEQVSDSVHTLWAGEKAELPQDVVAMFARIFNREQGRHANKITTAALISSPRGEKGKNGWFCHYAVFVRNGEPVLAVYTGHRLSIECYTEYAKDGSIVFSWSSWGGMMPISGYPTDYLRKFRSARRRAAESGIEVFGP